MTQPEPSRATAPRKEHQVLEGEVAAVLYQDEEAGFAVVSLETDAGRASAAGELAPVCAGESLRIHGRWTTHPRYGRQFKAAWSERVTPTTLEGLERYLGSGVFPGVGAEMASRLVAHFGTETLEALEQGARRLRRVPGIGPKRAASLSAAFLENRDRHRVLAELRGLGLSARQAAELYRRWQAGAIQRVRRDPYALIGEVTGFGFQSAEEVARALGLGADSPPRARGILTHLLRSAAREGHACLPAEAIAERLEGLQMPAEAVAAARAQLVEEGRLVVETDADGAKWCFLAGLWQDEQGVADAVRRLLAGPPRPAPPPSQLAAALGALPFAPDEQQLRAVELARQSPFSVLTGGPGTGKTTVMRLLLEVLQRQGVQKVRLASPTGRAAKRLQEAAGRQATTIHRLLGFDPRTMSFQHDAEQPLDADFLIVDEVSMLDLPLAHALLQAVPQNCAVLLVGDADQLPSVGPGTVLSDLVAADCVPSVRLQRIYRQAEGSTIVEAAHEVIAGRVPHGAPPGEPGDFFVVHRKDPEEAAALVERLVCERIPRRYGIDPMGEVLVLSPMYKGPLGVDQLNARLSRRLNPDGEGPEWAPFRVGDRVMVVRNDYEREVFNGDQGRVTAIESGEVLVEIDGRVQSYRPEQLADLVPSFCVTIHRAQGSEARAVVVAIGWSHYPMLQRNLLYTAITRGRELVVVVGDRGALARAVGSAGGSRRYGRLRARLRSTE